MNVAEVIQPHIHLLYTAEELKLAEWLGEKQLTKAEIEQIAGHDCTGLLQLAYHKATVNITDDENETRYSYNPVKMRIGNMATFHRKDWEALPSEVRTLLCDWHFEQFVEMKRAQSFEVVSAKGNKVLPLEHVIRYMRDTAQEVYVIPCDCKSTAENCDPMERRICLEFTKGANSAVARGYGEKITFEEAEEILCGADENGLLHTAEIHGICNCCSCCCYPGRTTMLLGHRGLWPKVLYRAVRNEVLCTQCGRCVQRCHKHAMVMDGTRPVLVEENCWGCGLCKNTCPAGAISLMELE